MTHLLINHLREFSFSADCYFLTGETITLSEFTGTVPAQTSVCGS